MPTMGLLVMARMARISWGQHARRPSAPPISTLCAMMRMFCGPDHRGLLPLSALAGGLYLLIMDTLARTVLMPIEIPIGVLTAMVGGPFFLYLLKRRNDA